VLRTLVVVALQIALLILLGMSFLRVNNLEYDVSVLKSEVERLKGQTTTATPQETIPESAPVAAASPTTAPPFSRAGVPPASPATAQSTEGLTAGFLDDGRETQVVALPAGMRPARARVTILAVEGEGAAERALPEPISFTLTAGAPHAVAGICQGPETAAWVFTLEAGHVRIASRDCEYPVRGLRPRLRITSAP
jgi:hypothetical protein